MAPQTATERGDLPNILKQVKEKGLDSLNPKQLSLLLKAAQMEEAAIAKEHPEFQKVLDAVRADPVEFFNDMVSGGSKFVGGKWVKEAAISYAKKQNNKRVTSK